MFSRLATPLTALPLTAFALGTWQVYRWQHKLQQLEHREQRRVTSPTPLPSALALALPDTQQQLEFRRVVCRGHFDHTREQVVWMRSHEGSAGGYVVTAFDVQEGPATGDSVLVNRGWVELQALKQGDWHRPQESLELTGVVRLTEKPGTFTPDNTSDMVYWMDHAFLNKQLKCNFPIRLDAVLDEQNPKRYPIGGQTVYWMPNNHVSYIFTWYGLSAALMYMLLKVKR